MNDTELAEWTKARILPRNVLVRKTTTFEVIERDGRQIGVKPGHYIIMGNDGKLWNCSEETFRHSYGEGWQEE
jgi:hypothetical protein